MRGALQKVNFETRYIDSLNHKARVVCLSIDTFVLLPYKMRTSYVSRNRPFIKVSTLFTQQKFRFMLKLINKFTLKKLLHSSNYS